MTSFQPFRSLRKTPEIDQPVADILGGAITIDEWFDEEAFSDDFPVDIAQLWMKLAKCEQVYPEYLPILRPLIRLIECVKGLHRIHPDHIFKKDGKFRSHAFVVMRTLYYIIDEIRDSDNGTLLEDLKSIPSLDLDKNYPDMSAKAALEWMPSYDSYKTDEYIVISATFDTDYATAETPRLHSIVNIPVFIDIIDHSIKACNYGYPKHIEDFALMMLKIWHRNKTYRMDDWGETDRKWFTGWIAWYNVHLVNNNGSHK